MKKEYIENGNTTDINESKDCKLPNNQEFCDKRPKLVWLIVPLSAVLPLAIIVCLFYLIILCFVGKATLSIPYPFLMPILFLLLFYHFASLVIGLWKGIRSSRNFLILLSVSWLFGSCWSFLNDDITESGCHLCVIYLILLISRLLPAILLFAPSVRCWFNRTLTVVDSSSKND